MFLIDGSFGLEEVLPSFEQCHFWERLRRIGVGFEIVNPSSPIVDIPVRLMRWSLGPNLGERIVWLRRVPKRRLTPLARFIPDNETLDFVEPPARRLGSSFFAYVLSIQ